MPENAYTALHTDLTLAADGGNADRVDELLKEGADPNRSAPGGATPLIAAMTSYRPGDRQRIIDALLEAGADPSKVDDKGNTPLMRAIDDPLTLMRQLLEAGADPNHVNNDGESAMDTALEFLPSTEHIEILVKGGVDTNRLLEHGETLLTDLLQWEVADVVELVLEYGAVPDMVNDEGQS